MGVSPPRYRAVLLSNSEFLQLNIDLLTRVFAKKLKEHDMENSGEGYRSFLTVLLKT